jgi:hypothetical protein
MRIDEIGDWYNLFGSGSKQEESNNLLLERTGQSLMSKNLGFACIALKEAYPHTNWQAWKFKRCPKQFWMVKN